MLPGAVLAALLALTGCMSSLDREIEELEREMARHERLQLDAADILRERSDADSLAAAAIFVAQVDPANALALINRATTAAPNRPELTWLNAQICGEATGCDPAPLEDRLRRQDPENGLGWFGAIERAYEAGDEAALDASLAAAGRSKLVNSHFTTLVARLSEATVEAGALSLPDAIVAATGGVAGFGLPRFVGVSKGCATDRLQRSGVLEACRSLAQSLMAGDTYLTEMIGVAIAKRAWPVDSADWQAASEARRVYAYQSAALRDHDSSGDWDEAAASEYLALIKHHRREQEASIAQLVAHGIDPIPPDDWHEDQPQ